MNKKRILKGNEFHHKAINEITVIFANKHLISVNKAALLASSIPAGIMDYDEDGNLVMSSQLSQHIAGMSIGYKLGCSTGTEETTELMNKFIDRLSK